MAILVVILVLMLGSANKLKTPRTINLSGDVTGSTNFDGSGNVTIQTEQSNIAVLTGSITIEASGSLTKDISYPSGFNMDNSIVISGALMGNSGKGYNYYGTYTNSGDGLNSAYTRRINLAPENVVLYVKNPNSSSLTVNYKIVLMKI